MRGNDSIGQSPLHFWLPAQVLKGGRALAAANALELRGLSRQPHLQGSFLPAQFFFDDHLFRFKRLPDHIDR